MKQITAQPQSWSQRVVGAAMRCRSRFPHVGRKSVSTLRPGASDYIIVQQSRSVNVTEIQIQKWLAAGDSFL
jgi:hypothetical protein